MSMHSFSDRRIQSFFPVALASLLVLGIVQLVLDNLKSNQSYIFRQFGKLSDERNRLPIVILPEDRIEEGCNVFEGTWTWDNVSYPLYAEESCPYLVKQVTCQKNGRSDSFYKNWRWQPSECNLPRFDALKLLEMLRGKRLMFVGDSVQRAQFESMVCLVQSVIPEGKKSLQRVPPMKIFKAEEFDASIEYYWAPFIVESISDHATNHTVLKRLVKLDSVLNHGKHWQGVDFLVFESYVWWMHNPLINATYGSPEDVQEYNVTTAYRLAMETWATWLESKINPLTQKVFFMSMSPTHLWNWEWKPGTGSDGNCFNELYPIQGPYWGTGSSLEIMNIVHDVLQKLKINVTLLNITQLSEYRKDAHTSVYGERKGKLLTKEQRANPKSFADCIHWCLPGVPDAWNEILYAYLLRSYQNFA
ncbi:Trichome birefringence-like family [Quillaja saponaria]|uniref:Trichome birefringence-like family n=1 Tax=Quillaja saponaria TaxID=32244 RepID=A0AAD7VNF1_QUISA|nr:Trichome birefringence-like family [Quillaja saponaria]